MSNYHAIKPKRIYDVPKVDDGYRVLVDRLWPRGVSKEEARLDEWLKDIAPSTELRKWYDHDLEKFEEFKQRYQEELKQRDELLQKLVEKSKEKPVTLLYAAKDERHNQAVILVDILRARQQEIS